MKMNTIVGQDVEIHGDVNAPDGLLIHGKIHGNVTADGKVHTGHSSFIKGNLTAREVVLGGTVKGDLKAEGKVILGKESMLAGNLTAKILVIEEGAKFEGVCNMSKETSSLELPTEAVSKDDA